VVEETFLEQVGLCPFLDASLLFGVQLPCSCFRVILQVLQDRANDGILSIAIPDVVQPFGRCRYPQFDGIELVWWGVCLFLMGVGNPTECIGHDICSSWIVLDLVVVLLESVQMVPLATCQLVLSKNVLQCCMVGVDSGTSSSVDIAGPVFQIRADYQEFSVVLCGVS